MKSFPPLLWILKTPSCLDLRHASTLGCMSPSALFSSLGDFLSSECCSRDSVHTSDIIQSQGFSMNMLVSPTILHLCIRLLLSVSI